MLSDERQGLGHYQTLASAIERAKWLSAEEVEQCVREAVESTPAIDVHTHLFPQSHGTLLLYGIDELLTYHYLVAEYFMVAPSSVTPKGKLLSVCLRKGLWNGYRFQASIELIRIYTGCLR